MRRRPPLTLVVFIVLVGGLVVAAATSEAERMPPLGAAVALGVLGALYLQVRVVWIIVTALTILNVPVALLEGVAWWLSIVQMGLVGLLLAPATRGYFRRQAPRREVSRGGRIARLGATVLAGIVLGAVAYAVLFPPDPIGGDLDLVRGDRPGLRVLFVGNRLTSDNAMITMLKRLDEGAPSGSLPIFAVRYTRPGLTLDEALGDERLRELLDEERWDRVVLQEHSDISSRAEDRRESMYPAARDLAGLAGRIGARTVLFMTWGYEDREGGVATGPEYRAMQAQVARGNEELAPQLGAAVAPVGAVWDAALRRRPGLALWGRDGRRPSRTGSYLAACVFYAVLTGRPATGSRFTAGLGSAQARWLQRLAGDMALRGR